MSKIKILCNLDFVKIKKQALMPAFDDNIVNPFF